MKREDVLTALDRLENEAINWAIGPLLRQRLEQEGWEEVIILQQLASAPGTLTGWNKLFDGARKALASPEDLPAKGVLLIAQVRTAIFNEVLDDFVAELLGVLYLAVQGHNSIRFLPEDWSARCFVPVKS